MVLWLRMASGVCAWLLATSSPAKNPPSADCQRYVGQTLQPISFAELVKMVPHAAIKKDQYETTEAFNARLADSGVNFSAPLIVRQDANPKLLSYDADKQLLRVSGLAFGPTPAGLDNVFRYANKYLSRSGQDDLAFTMVKTETGKRTYEATNGFGAKVQVEEVAQDVGVVWERPLELAERRFANPGSSVRLAEIKMTAEEARDLIEDGISAIVMTPKPPYYITGTSRIDPTFSQPSAWVSNITVVGADIQCALLITSTGTVRLAFDVK